MLEKTQQAVSQAQGHNPLLMQQQMLSEVALTSGLPAPHLATTPKNGALATSAPFAGGADVNVTELLAAAAAAAAANSAPMSASSSGDLASLHAAAPAHSAANPALLAAAMRPGALNMMNPAGSAGMPHMPPPGSLGSMQRMGSGHGMQSLPHSSHKHPMSGAHGMLPGHGGIAAGRAGNAQAAAAAAAIAAVAAQSAPGAGPNSDAARAAAVAAAAAAADSQGNILPLSRLQEIWSR